MLELVHHIKCTAFKCTHGSMRFGIQIMSSTNSSTQYATHGLNLSDIILEEKYFVSLLVIFSYY